MSALHDPCTTTNVLGETCGIPIVHEYGEVTPYCVKCTAKRDRIIFINRQMWQKERERYEEEFNMFVNWVLYFLAGAVIVAILINEGVKV